jgi:hypothetical protein
MFLASHGRSQVVVGEGTPNGFLIRKELCLILRLNEGALSVGQSCVFKSRLLGPDGDAVHREAHLPWNRVSPVVEEASRMSWL